MRITFVHNIFGSAARGGAEVIVALEAAGMVRKGHEVTVLTLGDKAGWERAPEGYLVRTMAIPGHVAYSALSKMSFAAKLLWHARDIWSVRVAAITRAAIAETRPDVVHTHNMMGFGYRVMRGLREDWTHVHTCHDVQLVHPSGLLPQESWWGVWRRLVCRSYAWVLSRIVGSPNAVVFPSKFLLEFYRRNWFFPLSVSQFLPNPSPEVREQCAQPETPTFLFVGQLERHKGVMMLLRVWEMLGADAPVLRIAGGGSLDAEVRARAARIPNVSVLGKLDREALAKEYAAAAWMVMPSIVIENGPAVLAESQAYGVPAIAAAIGGIPERVQDGVTGHLFAAGSVDALEKAVRHAIKMEHWEAMSRACQDMAANLSLPRHLDDLGAIYDFARGSKRKQ